MSGEDQPNVRINIQEQHDEYNGWNRQKQQMVRNWIDKLIFNQVVSYFYVFLLKKIENRWAWMVIVLSAVTSTIALVQFKDEDYTYLNDILKVLITIFTLMITLIASWMKKQNYIERIGTVDKYLQKINKLIAELEAQVQIDPTNRIQYSTFLEKYRNFVSEHICDMPLINPRAWKETMYILTKYYPEMVLDIEPWRSNPQWSENILSTYHKLKYRHFWSKIKSCYYCLCMCIEKEEEYEGDYDAQTSMV